VPFPYRPLTESFREPRGCTHFAKTTCALSPEAEAVHLPSLNSPQ